jgi:hypothetical protein
MKRKHPQILAVAFLTTMFAITGCLLAHNPPFTDDFGEESCTFATTGRNPYFILQPGYELVLEGEEDGDLVQVVITVLDETKVINGIETRVVRERETANGELVEISKNYFAICKRTNSVFYFGEDVNIYEDGEIVSHDGAWRAGVNGARAGIIMPGTILIGARYFNEIAPGVALDRAEIIRLNSTVATPFDTFTNVLFIRETTPLEPGVSLKYYVPGIGLIKDGPAELIRINTSTGTLYPRN